MREKKYKAIKIHCSKPEDIFNTHKCEMAKAIIEAIDFGITNKKKKVDFAQVIIADMIAITLSVDNKEFLDLIEQNLEILIEYEEYEICAKAVKLKEKIKNRKKQVTRNVGELIGKDN